MAAVRRQLGKPEAPAPELPEQMRPLWQTFRDLHDTRGGGFGEQAITYTEICSWMRANRVSLDPWEVETLRYLDREYLSME